MSSKTIHFTLLFTSLLCFFSSSINAQNNFCDLKVEYKPDIKSLKVHQKIVLDSSYKNNLQLQVWANAYRDKHSVLNKVKVEDRRSVLNFAKLNDRGWITSLEIMLPNRNRWKWLNDELIQIEKYNPGDTIQLSYTVKLPNSQISGYGIDNKGDLQLKYFFLKPALVYNCKPNPDNFRDLESVSAPYMAHHVTFDFPKQFSIQTNLNRISENAFYANSIDFVEISLKHEAKTFASSNGMVVIDFEINKKDQSILDSVLPRQIQFLEKIGGKIDRPIYISQKFRDQYKFIGVDDINIPLIGTVSAFTKQQRIALKSMAVLTHAYFNQKLNTQNNEYAWIENGLATYAQIEYIESEFPGLNLLGNLPNKIHIKDFYPLHNFEFSKIKMVERYNLVYQYIARSNTDQPIATLYSDLNKTNQIGVNSYKAGLGFVYLKEFIGIEDFNQSIFYFLNGDDILHTTETLKTAFSINSKKDVNWFFDDYIQNDQKINFSIKDVKYRDDFVKIKIKNNKAYTGPFKVSLYNNSNKKVVEFWEKENKSIITLQYKADSITKVVINEGNKPPEVNLRDNYFEKNSWTGNKKIKFRFIKDIDNPQFNQIFYVPQIAWNNYDKWLLGVKFSNKAILPQPFTWTLSPKYSTGENSIAGSIGANYSFFPSNSMFRRIVIGGAGSYMHYKPDLAYIKYISYSTFSFKRPLKSFNRQNISIRFEQFRRELYPNATDSERELQDYNLFKLNFNQYNPRLIHETRYRAELQVSNKFKKIFGDVYWRWQYKKDAYLTLRAFAGMFISHNLINTNYFDFGLDRITDYTFSYPLLGRSENAGIFTQQFVWAEGGFKSRLNKKANQYMTTINVCMPLWKYLEAYGDVGLYKSKDTSTSFAYDSGFRLNVIPDFLELYFPMYSTLGFEPTQSNYSSKIRFIFTFDLSKFARYWNQGRFK